MASCSGGASSRCPDDPLAGRRPGREVARSCQPVLRSHPVRAPARRIQTPPTPIWPDPTPAAVHRLRKFALALLAVPVIAAIVLGSLLRASGLARAGVALGLGAIIGLGAIALVRPATTTATPPSDAVPLTQAAFRTLIS